MVQSNNSEDAETGSNVTDENSKGVGARSSENDNSPESFNSNRLNKKHWALVVAVIVLIGLILGCVACTASQSTTAENSESGTQESAAEKEATSRTVNIEALGWDAASSTKFIVKLTDTTTRDEYRFEIEPNKDEVITAPVGEYEIEYISGVNADGSTYQVPDKSVVKLEKEAATSAPITVKVDKLDTDNGNKNDEQSAGTINSSEDVVNNTSSETKSDASNIAPAQSKSSSNISTPVHEHTWVDQTATKWVPNVVTVVDSPAWDEPVYETQKTKYYFCPACGYRGSSNAVIAHANNAGSPHHIDYGYETTQVQTGTTHHPAVTHTEDQGHNETVVTGQVCSGCGATR